MPNALTSSPTYTISPPFWKTPYRDAHYEVRTSLITGIPNSYGNYADEPAPVDSSIAPLIVALHRAGFPTSFCCSGLDDDHRGQEKAMPISGYISFGDDKVGELSPLLPPELYLDDGDSVIRSYRVCADRREITSAALSRAWDLFLSRINTVYNHAT